MKILKDTDWTPVGYVEWFEPMQQPVFLFQHKRFGDVVVLNVAKFINVTADIVYFYDANRNLVSGSINKEDKSFEPSVPRFKAYGV